MSTVGELSSVFYSLAPFSVTGGAEIPDAIVSDINIFNPVPLSQALMNAAYIFYPPANFSLVSPESALELLLAQAIE